MQIKIFATIYSAKNTRIIEPLKVCPPPPAPPSPPVLRCCEWNDNSVLNIKNQLKSTNDLDCKHQLPLPPWSRWNISSFSSGSRFVLMDFKIYCSLKWSCQDVFNSQIVCLTTEADSPDSTTQCTWIRLMKFYDQPWMLKINSADFNQTYFLSKYWWKYLGARPGQAQTYRIACGVFVLCRLFMFPSWTENKTNCQYWVWGGRWREVWYFCVVVTVSVVQVCWVSR